MRSPKSPANASAEGGSFKAAIGPLLGAVLGLVAGPSFGKISLVVISESIISGESILRWACLPCSQSSPPWLNCSQHPFRSS